MLQLASWSVGTYIAVIFYGSVILALGLVVPGLIYLAWTDKL